MSFTKYENDEIILECCTIADDLLNSDDMKAWAKLGAQKYKKVGLQLMGEWKVQCKAKEYSNCYELIKTVEESENEYDSDVYLPVVNKHTTLDEAISEVLRSFHSEDCTHEDKIQETWHMVTPDGVYNKYKTLASICRKVNIRRAGL